MFQERFFNMTRAYYKGAVGALIVFDWSNVKTFDAVDKWKRDLVSTVAFLITGYSRVFMQWHQVV